MTAGGVAEYKVVGGLSSSVRPSFYPLDQEVLLGLRCTSVTLVLEMWVSL